MAIRSNQSLADLATIVYKDPDTGGILINTDVYLEVGNSTAVSTINSTFFDATANNANYLGGVAANNYVTLTTDSVISANVTFQSNVYFANSSTLVVNGVSFFDGNVSFSNTATFTSNIVLADTATIIANGQFGSTGQSLISNGSSVYWGIATPANPSPLVFTPSGATRSLTGYQESGTTYVVRTTAITGGSLQLTLATFTPGLFSTVNPSSSLNWDVPSTGFTVNVTNPSDFTSEFISNVYSVYATSGVVSNLNLFTAGSKSTTPAGGVNWSQSFTLGSGYIYSTSNTLAGGSASANVDFVANNNGTESHFISGLATFSVNWNTPSLSISTAGLSGDTFLQSYSSTTYSINVSGITNSSNYSHLVTGLNGTVSNTSGSGALNFANNIHKDNTGTTRTANVVTTFTRPAGVTGTSYSTTLSGYSSVSASFTYPSLWLFTSSASNPPARSDIVSGTGFQGSVNILGNQQKTFAGFVTNSQGTPQEFWLAVRASASQPTTFQTGASAGLLSGVSYVTGTVALQPDSPLPGYNAETYNLYGITLQPGSTYVSIS